MRYIGLLLRIVFSSLGSLAIKGRDPVEDFHIRE
jgi:hypothetical protein